MPQPVCFALVFQTKADLISHGRAEATILERNILQEMQHPFVVQFVSSFKSPKFLFIVLEMLQGGELFSRIHDYDKKEPGLPEQQCKFYGLCLADALAYVHTLGYVFRGKLSVFLATSHCVAAKCVLTSYANLNRPQT